MDTDARQQQRTGDGGGVSVELRTFLRKAVADGPTVLLGCACEDCGGRVFTVRVDGVEGCAGRECVRCKGRDFLADSAEVWWEADPAVAECPCGGDEFEAAVAFSLTADGAVRWVAVGPRCQRDGTPGVHVDWKIDYAPVDHLLRAG
ncbi:hypothetical protein K353_00428 [Kitasatospora sp. SolWspMP-SS2h]|uniref:hypothetical protein n=1 Tax=Kitasatospora sp. SolWspMP-SS2h TaxID=1305729 RepID=UPI000DBA59D0|nr:hypothetical protein [Kitasatospora sp. SolWspMP-SS2h]RAJ47226.1 hypothetical protein K353_00428 [Kitasatospora sp. SolWspMP-SS2h]